VKPASSQDAVLINGLKMDESQLTVISRNLEVKWSLGMMFELTGNL
jgi:hypothetical protein